MIANILNISVDVIESEEGPGLGGAMLAAVACGEYASVEEAARKDRKGNRYCRARSGTCSKIRGALSAV